MTRQEFAEWIKSTEESFQYQLLSRMQMDCNYFLGNGNRLEKHLWAESVEEHIDFMLIIYDNLLEKPEWLSLEDIQKYESAMKNN